MSLEEFERKRWLIKDPWGAVTRVVQLEAAIKKALDLCGDPYYQEKVLREALSNNVQTSNRAIDSGSSPRHQ